MNSAAVEEVLKLKKAGLGEDSIVAFVQRQNVNYDLSADDLILLKNQGVSSSVLAAMLSRGVPVSPSTPPPNAPPPNVPPPVTQAVSPAVAAPALALPPGMSADAAYFYQQLSPHGRWVMAEDNQWYWQPTVAVGAPSWRPYWDSGHWVYTDSGWYWASDYPWGWAAFHYGRWRLHPLHGWMWLPDRTWAPAWVTWRAGFDYCGWAPLPPGTVFDAGGAIIFRGRRVAADFDFGLDWHHFNFCRVRDIEDSRHGLFRRDADRRGLFNRTTVVNNYTTKTIVVENRPTVRLFNHGIDPVRVALAKGRNVETITIHDLHSPPPNHRHERFDHDRKTLEIYRPRWDDRDRR